MALTQITTTGIADDAITADKLPTNLDLIDNQKIRFGTSNDFEVYHDGTRSWVRDSGSGNLIIDTDGSEIDINSGGNAEYMARFIKDGSVELYYDNSKKIETKSYGVNMPDNSQLYFGTGDDLVIKHDGSNSYIVNATGALHIRNDGIYFKNSGGSESFIDCSPNAEVSLFYDNSKKIETTSWGVDVTGTLRADDISLQDSHILKIGSDNDLQLTHSGNDSTISKTTAGNLLIYVEEDFYLKHGTEVMLAAKDDGAVELYNDGSLISATGSAHLDQYARIKIHASNSGGFGGHQMAIGEWDGANHRIEGDANRPIFITSYNSGGVKLGVSGTNEVTVTGDGLTFNGDTAAANALDDYEEGSWTPTVPGGGTMNIYNASYTKVGRLVTWWTYIYITSIPNNSTGFTIGGFPFTSGSTSNMGGSAVCAYSGSLDTSDFGFYKNTGDTNISCYLIGGGSVGGTILNSHIQGATRYFALSGQYYT